MKRCSWASGFLKRISPTRHRGTEIKLTTKDLCASVSPWLKTMKPIASVSLDLDNKWSYMKTHGDAGWETFPSYLDILVPRVLEFLHERKLQITVFVVGQDAVLQRNRRALQAIASAGHELGNHSF